MRDSGTFVRFVFIGGASTAVYFTLLIVLRHVITSTALLTSLCYGLSMVFNFLAQGLLTFRKDRLEGRHLRRYIITQGSALFLNSLVMVVLVDTFGAHLIVAQIFVTACITVCVYILSKLWIYQ